MSLSNEKKEFEKCPICGQGVAWLTKVEYTVVIRGMTISIPNAEGYRCKTCSEEYFTSDQAHEVSNRVISLRDTIDVESSKP